ncbi:hypothetical protein K8M07_03290 [Schnuerera sp. xch1]|uniref:alginate O-acetyltransferase AlgX-related protein n=1 Tax=Schnuerera sp. xch1 TaxID=2874283 RepID=UPI001CBE8A32|nr:hypothetical protein [Schnuerera sp. xch1]MBZ2174266.1 hypothetical protein [Schnuerera sp. xch1]
MNNYKAKWITIPFIIIIMTMSFMNIISKDKEVSASENRTLQQKPTIEDIKDGSFTDKFEEYFSDQFTFREELFKMYAKTKLALGFDKVKSYFILDNNWIMPTPSDEIPDAEVENLAEEINRLAKIGLETNKEIYYVSTPHKDGMLSHLYPQYTDGLDNYLNNRDKLKKHIDTETIKYIDLNEYFLKAFTEEEREDLYFKTDHHWNGIGAFEGFKYIINNMNILENIPWNRYITTTLDKGSFLGSYNMNLNKLVNESEEIPYVHTKDKSDYEYFKFDGKKDVKVKEEDVIATERDKEDILYGGAYMFGKDCSILKIRNKKSISDKKIIIFRDSYQAPTSWLFADVFAEVQLVDPRHIDNLGMNVDDIMRESDADIAMFMYNNSAFKMMIEEMKEQR